LGSGEVAGVVEANRAGEKLAGGEHDRGDCEAAWLVGAVEKAAESDTEQQTVATRGGSECGLVCGL
jgi:hypothetical protein